MNLTFPTPEFDDVVAAVCHGSATETEMCALNALLRDDSRARDEYILRVALHTRLASDPDLFAHTADPSVVCRPGDTVLRNRQEVISPTPTVPAPRRRRTRVPVLAACLVLTTVGVWGFWLKRTSTRQGATSTAVAMLTRAVDAHWDPSDDPPRVGSALDPGWLRLEAGMVQVVFYSGARVVIEGPAELRLVSPDEAYCRIGRLLAEVPEPARGFRLTTDSLSVVDLGTSFGVDAAEDRTEVHVFKGKVEVLASTRPKQSLSEAHAVMVQGHDPPRLMAASAGAFHSMFDFQQRSLASEAFRYERWQFTSAQLNQDPSLVVHLDFENLHGPDWTLHNSAANNESVPEAVIVGCSRAEGRWREKQALEFQTVNDRVRLVVPGEFDSLTLSAWVCVMGLDRKFNSLFMCDGFAPGSIHWLIRNDGVLGITVFGEGPGIFQILPSPPVISLDQIGRWLHLAVVLDGPTGQVVQYVNGSPVSRHSLMLDVPFRLGAAELGNWRARSGPRPAPSLVRNLSGALDEFTLFSRALSDAEVRELHTKGKP